MCVRKKKTNRCALPESKAETSARGTFPRARARAKPPSFNSGTSSSIHEDDKHATRKANAGQTDMGFFPLLRHRRKYKVYFKLQRGDGRPVV